MSKYDPLKSHLERQANSLVPMSFAEIEALLGFALPPSARDHRAWWSNNPSNNVMTKTWLAAGYETEDVDLAGQRLVFRRSNRGAGTAPLAPPRGAGSRATTVSIVGVLRGSVTLAPGTDLTKPANGRWDAEA
jgi:hypothetical protein